MAGSGKSVKDSLHIHVISERNLMSSAVLRLILLFVLFLAVVLFLGGQEAHAGTTKATSYGPGLFGNTMACGGKLNVNTIAVAAMPGMACGRKVQICWNGKCGTFAIRDRCPSCSRYKRFDLSQGLVQRVFGVRSSDAWGVKVVWWRYV